MEGSYWTRIFLLVPLVVATVNAQLDFEGQIGTFNKKLGETPVDLVFLVDTSKTTNTTESLDEETSIKVFLSSFLDDADIDSGNVRVAMVTYSTHPHIVFGLNSNKNKEGVQNAIFDAEFNGGDRNTADALSRLRSYVLTQPYGDRPDVPNVVLVLQSGKSNLFSERTAQEAEALKYARTIVFGLGLKLSGEGQEELEQLSSRPVTENTFIVDNAEELTIINDMLFAQIFSRAELAYNSPAAGSDKLDVAFLLHYSSSMKKQDFQAMLDFMKNTLQYSGLDYDNVRVAAAVYRKRASQLFDFNVYYTKDDLFAAIDQLSFGYRAKSASAASGLDLVRTQLFTDQAGARRDVPNLCVLITDTNADTDVPQTITSAEQLKATGATIFTIGLNVTYKDELNGIATSEKTTIYVDDIQDLAGKERVLQEQFLALRTEGLPYIETSTIPTTTTPAAVTTPSPSTTVDNLEELDVVLAFHASKKVPTADIKKKLQVFLKDLVTSADIDSGAVRIALVSFDKDAKVLFNLNQYNKKKKMAKAVRKLKSKSLRSKKETDVVNLLNVIQTDVLTQANGDRTDVPNAIFVITDSPVTSDSKEYAQTTSALHSGGLTIFGIGVDSAIPDDIQTLSSQPTEEYSYLGVDGYNDFVKSPEMREKIAKKFKIFENLKIPTKKKPKTPKPTKTPKKITTPLTTTKKLTTIAPTYGSVTSDYFVDKTTHVSTEASPLKTSEKADILIALHLSPKASPNDFFTVKEFIKDLISGTNVDNGDVQIGMIFYAADPQIIFHINQYKNKDDMLESIDGIDMRMRSFETDASGALALGRQMLSQYYQRRDDVPAAMLFITDDVSTVNEDRIEYERERGLKNGIEVYAAGIGLPNKSELEKLVTSPKNIMKLPRLSDIRSLTDDIEDRIKALRVADTKDFTTPDPKTTTSTEVMTEKTTPAPVVVIPTDGPDFGLTLGPELPCGLAKTDLVFTLDASTSVTEENFQKMRDFVKTFVDNADVDSGSVRVGLSIYSTGVQVEFHLNKFNNKRDLMNAIDGIPYIYGSTNTADALQSMRDDMFTFRNGDRPDAVNIGIVVTDGISNINSRRTVPEAERTHEVGIEVFAIGIGLTDRRELDAIGSSPKEEHSFNVQSFDELKGLEQRIFSFACPGSTTPALLDLPPKADAGRDVTLVLPDSTIVLAGDKSTDDFGIVKYVWDLLDGPARVNVKETEGQFLKLDNLEEGVYVIELEVTDTRGQTDQDTVVLNVLPEPNEPPVANAGSDKTVQLPDDSIYVYGDQSTDDKAVTFYDWDVDFGTSGGRFRADNDRLYLFDLEEGVINVALTVFDAQGESDTDTTQITVLAEPDAPPVANAGNDVEIQLPVDNVRLDGSASSDDIRVVSYDWKLESGDKRGLRSNGATTPYLNLYGLQAGDYEYKLTVADKRGQTDSDNVRISVKPPRTTGYDVIFVLDSSVSPTYFNWMIDYSRKIIREMSIDDGEFRVGYLIYSNSAYRQFNLNEYDTKDKVLSGVDRVTYRTGRKNTASALKYVRNQMFTSSRGDRDFAPNYIIHLTGEDPSIDPFDAATEACKLQNEGVGMFATGFGNVNNRDEIHATSSLPTEEYTNVIKRESDMGETPGLLVYTLKNQEPRPSPCPVTTTTEMPTTTYDGPRECTSSGDIIFILDSSGSVGQVNFYRVLNFTYETVSQLDVDSGHFRIGVTTFSDTSRLDFNLDEFNSKDKVENALKEVIYMYGNTHTAHALRRVRTEMFTPAAGDRPDVPNIVVIITDGQSNVNHEMTIPEARSLKAAGVSIITVAVGFTQETSELVGLTSPPLNQNLIYVEDYESLGKLKNKLVEPLCKDSNLCRSKKPCKNGGVCMDGIRTFTCLCPPNFFGDTCNKECGDPADVVVVLDSSSSVGEYNFGRLKEYAEHLVREMNKDSCDVNLGFMKYSSNAMVQVYLGMHRDTETNIRAIDRISYSRGRANMAAAFRALRTEMFNGARGDRPNARNIAYFLTDGTNDVNAELTESEADLTISSGVRVIPIGVNMKSRYELDNIAGVQGINLIEIDDEPALIENTDEILRPLYEGNDFCAENPCNNGGTCRNEPFGFRCDCLIGYTGDTCNKRCTAKGDVVFAVDTSRYVTRSEMKRMRKFLRSIVKRMNFRRDGFSVGMVTFSDWAKVTMEFDEGNSKRTVRSKISGLRVHGGDPEPSQALAKANYRIFKGRGASDSKPDYLILLTKSMRNEMDILDEANKLKVQGIRIIGVGLGLTETEKEALQSTVSLPVGETAMFADDSMDLEDIADSVVTFMCDDEDLCAENPCLNGGVCNKRGGDFFCECAFGYAGRYCQNECNARADIVLLLDSSGSVGHGDFRQVKTFAHNLVEDLSIGKDYSRVGLASYSTETRHGFYMNKFYDKPSLQNAIAGVSYEYGNTNTAAGLRLVRERYFSQQNGDRPNIQDFVIVITDGVSNVQPEETLIEAKRLKEQGVHVYAVGIGDFDTTELNAIASEPSSENAFILKDYNSLSDISSDIVKKTCRDPSVCDENPCRNGGVCVPGINGAFCECPVGFRGETCETSCVTTKDIFFVLDSSDSVGLENWNKMLAFVGRIAEDFSSKDTYNRFSLITYSTSVQIVFSLGRYKSYPIIRNAIKYARYRPGRTNTAGALRTAHEFSSPSLGDRSDAENIVFLITDGLSNVKEEDTIPAARDLKEAGARIIPIAVNMEDYSEVDKIATNSDEVYKVYSYDDLDTIIDALYLAICENGNVIETNGRK